MYGARRVPAALAGSSATALACRGASCLITGPTGRGLTPAAAARRWAGTLSGAPLAPPAARGAAMRVRCGTGRAKAGRGGRAGAGRTGRAGRGGRRGGPLRERRRCGARARAAGGPSACCAPRRTRHAGLSREHGPARPGPARPGCRTSATSQAGAWCTVGPRGAGGILLQGRGGRSWGEGWAMGCGSVLGSRVAGTGWRVGGWGWG